MSYGCHFQFYLILFLYPYPRIHCHHIVAIGEEGVDVEFLYLGGEAEESGEADDNLGVFLLVDSIWPRVPFIILYARRE